MKPVRLLHDLNRQLHAPDWHGRECCRLSRFSDSMKSDSVRVRRVILVQTIGARLGVPMDVGSVFATHKRRTNGPCRVARPFLEHLRKRRVCREDMGEADVVVVRVLARQAGGHWFEPSTAHHKKPWRQGFFFAEIVNAVGGGATTVLTSSRNA
jgi:hypothetical protein